MDHIDHDKTNNHIWNLRWTNQSLNCKNKSSHMGKKYTFIEYSDEPEDLIEVDEYGNHYRELPILMNKKGLAYVWAEDSNKKRVAICFNKFKRIYGFN